MGKPFSNAMAHATAVSTEPDATDKSMLPLLMTNVIPKARKATGIISEVFSSRYSPSRK